MRFGKHAFGLGLLFLASSLTSAFASAPALAQTSSNVGAPYPACGKDHPVTAADSQAAHSRYLSGKVDYDEARYDAAIAQFRDAYARDCTKHELLIIISRAYELDLDLDEPTRIKEAIRALETYLDRVPNAPDAAAYRERITNLKGRLDKAQKAAAATPAPTGSSSSASTPDPNAGGTTPPPAEEPRGHTALPWIVVGAGAVAAAVGVVVVATAPELPPNCDPNTQKCTRQSGESQTDFDNRTKQAGASQTQPTYGYITIAGGAALVVGGLLWHFLEPTGPKEETSTGKPKLAPQLAPGFAGLSLGGRF